MFNHSESVLSPLNQTCHAAYVTPLEILTIRDLRLDIEKEKKEEEKNPSWQKTSSHEIRRKNVAVYGV